MAALNWQPVGLLVLARETDQPCGATAVRDARDRLRHAMTANRPVLSSETEPGSGTTWNDSPERCR